MTKDYTTLSGIIRKGSKYASVKVVIRDELAIVTFSEKGLAKQVYERLIMNGKEAGYSEEHDAVMEHFAGKSQHEVLKIMKKEISDNGGQLNG